VGWCPKLVWRVKLVAELRPGVTTETEVARIERGEAVGLAGCDGVDAPGGISVPE
jgi:hypothetical protein